MKAKGFAKKLNYSLLMIGVISSMTTATVYADNGGAMMSGAPNNVYVSIFGGWSRSNSPDITQFGTAFYPDRLGGPVAVNAFGHVNRRSVGFIGGQLGFQWMDIGLDAFTSGWRLAPAFEIEGYYLGKKSFDGEAINNTVRLPEHDFLVDYPMKTSVYLVNAVVSFNGPCSCWHPYFGLGIGSALLSVSGADAFQLAPAEPGVNHYNAEASDKTSAFAGQIKLGVDYEFNPHFSVFAEYRWLYIAATKFAFGSTVAPGHFETSNWDVKLDPQRYNMIDIGLRYKF